MKPIYKLIKTELGSYVEMTDTNGLIWSVPIDEANADYQAYLKSLENAN